jgi:superfamily II DNA/RNA helicase
MSQSFASLGVSSEVVQALSARGICEPFRIQTLVVPAALAGRDVLGQAPTGSGKTLAFGLPLVECLSADDDAPAALVLCPTRELALQVTEELSLLGAPRGIRAAAAYGGAPVASQAKRLRGAQIVVATPGRLNDLVQRRLISLAAIRILVLDEADRMLDMGFLPQVERIIRVLPKRRQTMLFSATLSGDVGELARAYTTDPSRFEAELPSQHSDGEVEHRFVAVTAHDKVERLVGLLEADRGLALVFVRTKRGADRLVKRLASNSVRAVAMHGDKSQSQRERALASFESGSIDTLVATDVAARGIDVADITHVINYDIPGTREDYVHRIGRTARAGASGVGVTLVTHEQARELSVMIGDLGLHRELELGGLPSDFTGQRARSGGGSSRSARQGAGNRGGGRPGAGANPRRPRRASKSGGRAPGRSR